MKSVYIIMSPEGGIGLNIFTGKGTVYANKAQAIFALMHRIKERCRVDDLPF